MRPGIGQRIAGQGGRHAQSGAVLAARHHFQRGKEAETQSNHAVASDVAVVVASLGCTVLAPNGAVHGASKGMLHPCLFSAPMAASLVDFLTDAKTWRLWPSNCSY